MSGLSEVPRKKWWVFGDGPDSDDSPPQDVPDAVREAYGQALFLKTITPKASGALSRYCIQSMIYDYWAPAPKERTPLASDLDRIANKLPAETSEAINVVRNYGTIESQFGEDVNLMVPTTAEEALLLICLTQVLFKDWYVERGRRRKRCEAIKGMAEKSSRVNQLQITKDEVRKLASRKEAAEVEPPAEKEPAAEEAKPKPSRPAERGKRN